MRCPPCRSHRPGPQRRPAVSQRPTTGSPPLPIRSSSAAVDEAMVHNADLRVGAARVEQSLLHARLAGARLYPSVDVLARGGGKMSGDNSGLSGAALTVGWEVDLWGRVRYGRAAARADAASTQADFEFARQSIAARVARSWFLADGSGSAGRPRPSHGRRRRGAGPARRRPRPRRRGQRRRCLRRTRGGRDLSRQPAGDRARARTGDPRAWKPCSGAIRRVRRRSRRSCPRSAPRCRQDCPRNFSSGVPTSSPPSVGWPRRSTGSAKRRRRDCR